MSSRVRNLSQREGVFVVKNVFDGFIEALQREERIEIRGFGNFVIRHYKSYNARNPKTGEPVKVSPKRLPFFKVSEIIKRIINSES